MQCNDYNLHGAPDAHTLDAAADRNQNAVSFFQNLQLLHVECLSQRRAPAVTVDMANISAHWYLSRVQ